MTHFKGHKVIQKGGRKVTSEKEEIKKQISALRVLLTYL